MYQLRNGFRLLSEDIYTIRQIDSEKIKPSEAKEINSMYSYYLDGKTGNYDLIKVEQQEDKSRNITRIKLRLLNWLIDYMTATPDVDFFFRVLSCRPAAQILVSCMFYKV